MSTLKQIPDKVAAIALICLFGLGILAKLEIAPLLVTLWEVALTLLLLAVFVYFLINPRFLNRSVREFADDLKQESQAPYRGADKLLLWFAMLLAVIYLLISVRGWLMA